MNGPCCGIVCSSKEPLGEILSIAFSPDGNIFATGSSNGAIRLWRGRDGQAIRTLEGHSDWVSSVAWIGDARLLASGSYDSTVKFWDVASGACITTLDHRPYAGADITAAKGLTEAQRDTLLALGAVDRN